MLKNGLFFLLFCCFFVIGNATENEDSPAPTKEEIKTFLDRYVGSWSGKFTITNADGVIAQQFEVEQTYWWKVEDRVWALMGRAVFSAGDNVSYSDSKSYIDGNQLFSLIQQGGRTRLYEGKLSVDRDYVIWTPTGDARSHEREFFETFLYDKKVPMLESRSYETMTREGKNLLMLVYGLMEKATPKGTPTDEQ